MDIKDRPDTDEWKQAFLKEKHGLEQKAYGEYIRKSDIPAGTRVVRSKTIFLRKLSGAAKVRVVAKDFRRQGEPAVYAPVVEEVSQKVFLTIAASENLEIRVCDIEQAFLNSFTDENVVLTIPEGFEDESFRNNHYILLNKSLYGLRRSPFLWNQTIHTKLLSMGFLQSSADACVYIRHTGAEKTILLLHVDDLRKDYGVKDLGNITQYLSYQVIRDRPNRQIIFHQQDFTASLLAIAGMDKCYASKSKGDLVQSSLTVQDRHPEREHEQFTYRQITGGLQHLACHARPDIAYEAATLAKFNTNYSTLHVRAAKQLLQYLKYTAHYGLHCGGHDLNLYGYADAGTVTDPSGRGVGGYAFKFGTATIAFKSKWFTKVHPSTTELEYVTLFMASSKAIWIRKLLTDLGYTQKSATPIFEDNEGAIKYAHSQERAGRMGHLNVKFHFVRERIMDHEIDVQQIPGNQNVGDIMTKSEKGSLLSKNRDAL